MKGRSFGGKISCNLPQKQKFWGAGNKKTGECRNLRFFKEK